MSKPAKRKTGVKRRRKSGWDIDRRSIEAEWEAALLQMPEEILREEIAFWSWSDTPEGEQWIEISDKLDVLLKDVGIDPEERTLTWPDAIRLDLDQSIRRINKQYPCFSEDNIKEFLIFWLQAPYAMWDGYSKSKMAKLERLHDRWVADLEEEEK
jgi:hypothetical protein